MGVSIGTSLAAGKGYFMSKFLEGGREGHGRERQADFAFAGGMAGPASMTPIERLLTNNGLKGPDVKDSAIAIMTLMERMQKDPLSAKLSMVNNFIAPMMRGAERSAVVQLVNKTIDMAEDQIARKAAAMAPATPKQSAPVQTVSNPKMGR